MKEIKRNDNPFWSAVMFEDEKGKLHFYNPAISLEQFKEIMNQTDSKEIQ